MTVLSAGSLTNLRTKQAEATLYLSIHQPSTLLAAQVNNASIARGARSIAYDTGSGALFSLAEAGQTLEVDTSTGTEKIRIKSISGTVSNGTIGVAENDIVWADNQAIRIKHTYELWPIPPTIRSDVFYKDFDIAYSTQNSQPNPVAIGGSHQAIRLILASVSITIPSASSYGFNGATISSRICTVAPSAGVTVTPSGNDFTVEFTATGQYWVKLTVTDSNGKSQHTYRLVFVHGTGYEPYTDFSMSSITGDWESGGWRFQVAANGNVALSDFPDGSIAVLWYDNKFDGAAGFVDVFGPNSQQIICAGYLRSDNNTDNFADGTGVSVFEMTTPEALLDAMTDFGSVSIGAVSSPATWYEGPSWMHIGFGVHHELLHHSTAMQCLDIFGLASTPLGVKNIDFTEGSILQRVNGIAWQRGILSKVVSNRLGQLYLVGDSQMLNTSGRAALDTVFSITDADISEDINIPRQPEQQTAVTDMNGFAYTHPTSTPFISIIPGYRESSISFAMPEFRGTGSAMFGSQVVASQTDMNEKIGRVHAAANNPLSEVRINFRSNYLGAFDIVCSLGWYTVGLSNGDFKRGLSLNGKKMLCRSITHTLQFEDSSFNGVILTGVIFEVEAIGPDGIQGNYPTSFPVTEIPPPEGVPEQGGGIYGYFSGGSLTSGTETALTDRITFSTGVAAAHTDSNLAAVRADHASVSDTVTYGYVAGGRTQSTLLLTAERITFSTGAFAANTASNLSQARIAPVGVSDGATYGYFGGGGTSTGGAVPVVTTDRITFSTGVTAANTNSNLSSAREGPAGVSDGATYGYFGGGGTSNLGSVVTTDRITFSTSVTAANTNSDLSQARSRLRGISDNDTYGYFCGGYSGTSTAVVTTDRLTFSTGVAAANTDSDLSGPRTGGGALSDGVNYGYYAGGSTSTNGSFSVLTTEKIDFTTGITDNDIAASLSIARFQLSGVSDGAV